MSPKAKHQVAFSVTLLDYTKGLFLSLDSSISVKAQGLCLRISSLESKPCFSLADCASHLSVIAVH